MGHVTVCARDDETTVEELLETARNLEERVTFQS